MSEFEQIIIKPIITEKASLAKMGNVYCFAVDSAATKIDVRRAVEKLFKVHVESVNTSKIKGKKRRTGRSVGRTAGWKKAFIKIKPGQKIDMIEGMI